MDTSINNIKNIYNISKHFNYRHDFISEDLEKLKNKFNNIGFFNIPEAWIILLDTFLEKHSSKIKEIRQHFGFLCVVYLNDISNSVKKDQKILENNLSCIDKDLF